MKIMCDTNIIIDVLLERKPFVEDSYKVLTLCEEHKIDGFVSASSVVTGVQTCALPIQIVKICSVTNQDVLIAFQKKARDFEDCLVATCAKSIHCNYIVTRNKKDFEDFNIPLLTPKELLQQFE